MSTFTGSRVAIIGGAGFIGHHLALALRERGADVLAVDSLQVNNLLAVASGEGYGRRELYMRMLHQRLDLLRAADVQLLVQDARDYHALGRLLGAYEPTVVVHMAAVAHANRSNKDPFSTFDHSLRTLENALDTARERTDHFVYMSSSMVYGDWTVDAVTEDHPLEPLGIYGALKLAGERIVIAYKQTFDLDYTIVRPSALYGPRCVSGRVGQVFVENALEGLPLRVRQDGGGLLDFTFVDDLVDGLCRVVCSRAARNQTFNLTHGGARRIEDLADVVAALVPGTVIHREPLTGDPLTPRRGTLSVERAHTLLGYTPRFDLEHGVERYVASYRNGLEWPP